ncbi:LuxR C-terminal-related transcriptional regulator [Labrys sp. KB_33_2]|uniref:response regulator transcription factor n=1 Tax=Labrys sp. KB_33_2 TaxID=3237479 RepID=UPI003F8F2496
MSDLQYVGNIALISSNVLIRDCLDFILTLNFPQYRIQVFSAVDEWGISSSPVQTRLVILHDRGYVDASRTLATARANDPHIPVLVLANASDAASIVQAIDLGARGYVPSSLPVSDLIFAVNRILAGGTFVPPETKFGKQAWKPLTPRQLSIVAAIRQGKTNAQIGKELGISESTVKVHVRRIMKQMQVINRTAIAHRSKDILSTDED